MRAQVAKLLAEEHRGRAASGAPLAAEAPAAAPTAGQAPAGSPGPDAGPAPAAQPLAAPHAALPDIFPATAADVERGVSRTLDRVLLALGAAGAGQPLDAVMSGLERVAAAGAGEAAADAAAARPANAALSALEKAVANAEAAPARDDSAGGAVVGAALDALGKAAAGAAAAPARGDAVGGAVGAALDALGRAGAEQAPVTLPTGSGSDGGVPGSNGTAPAPAPAAPGATPAPAPPAGVTTLLDGALTVVDPKLFNDASVKVVNSLFTALGTVQFLQFSPCAIVTASAGLAAYSLGLTIEPTLIYIAPTGLSLAAIGLDIAPTLIGIGPGRSKTLAEGFAIAPTLISIAPVVETDAQIARDVSGTPGKIIQLPRAPADDYPNIDPPPAAQGVDTPASTQG